MTLLDGIIPQCKFLPIGIRQSRNNISRIYRGYPIIGSGLVGGACIFRRIHSVRQNSRRTEIESSRIFYFSLTFFSPLGLYHNDTITGTGTIYRRCTGILQNTDFFNIRRVQAIEILCFANYSIDNIQRSTTTTNRNSWSRSRFRATLLNDNTRRTSL